MVRTGSRAHINSDGMAPLANTGTGAAGSVLGTERKNLQDIFASIVGVVGNIFTQVYASFITVQPASDVDANVAIRGINAAGTLQRWYIRQDGLSAGILGYHRATLATSLLANIGVPQNVLATTLPAGNYLVQATIATDSGQATVELWNSALTTKYATGYVPRTLTGRVTASLPAAVVPGGTALVLRVTGTDSTYDTTVHGGEATAIVATRTTL